MSKQVSDSDRRPHIENSSLWVRKGEEDPMSQRFRIASTDFLDEIEGRTLCDRCLRSRKYFCYTCIVPLPEVRDRLPVVSLPIKVDIIKHSQEVDGKSTAIHAPIIAPDDCTIHTFPDIPDWTGLRVVLVFPGPEAKTVGQLIASHRKQSEPNTRGLPFDRVVFIDSTWRQTKAIVSDPRMRPLLSKCVVLREHESLFWRHQRHTPRTYLSTIEAIYYFFVELDKALNEVTDSSDSSDGHQYDNLLFFFKHTYNRLRKKYNI